MSYTLFVRKPILDRRKRVFAYELLYCDNPQRIECTPEETTAAILNSILQTDLQRFHFGKRLFIRLTPELTAERDTQLLPKDNTIFFVPDEISKSDNLLNIESLNKLIDNNYTLSYQGATYEQNPSLITEPILQFDLSEIDQPQSSDKINALQKRHTRLLATGVDSWDDFLRLKIMGFDYFSGNFITQINNKPDRNMLKRKQAALELLSSLTDPDISLIQLEEIILRDYTLEHRVVKSSNAACFGLSQIIENVNAAVQILGLKQLKKITTLISLAGLHNKPQELLTIGLIRATMAERIATLYQEEHPEKFFIVGLFSILDALFDKQLGEIINNLPLEEDISEALLLQKGAMGKVLTTILAYEHADWENVNLPKMTTDIFLKIYLKSLYDGNNLTLAVY